jgi:hypothetical protein
LAALRSLGWAGGLDGVMMVIAWDFWACEREGCSQMRKLAVGPSLLFFFHRGAGYWDFADCWGVCAEFFGVWFFLAAFYSMYVYIIIDLGEGNK